MEQTITPEERSQRMYDIKRNTLPNLRVLLRADDVQFLLGEVVRVRQEALAQGWAACEKEVVYKGRYFNECKGWLHVDMKDIANPHKDV